MGELSPPIFPPTPPYSDKTVFFPPLSHFLNEGLTTHVRGEEQHSGRGDTVMVSLYTNDTYLSITIKQVSL